MSGSAVWFTWEDHRRSRELADAFGATYWFRDVRAPRAIRYLILSFSTLRALSRARPGVVFCQNPSIMLAALLACFRPVFGYCLVVDRHSNFKLHVKDSWQPKWRIFHLLSRYSVRRADITIVTNEYLKQLLESWGGRGYILPDKLPALPLGEVIDLAGEKNFAFICTFSEDEPVDEVLAAFSAGDPGLHLYVTGNYRKSAKYSAIASAAPANVHFSGFLSERDYQSLLKSVDGLIVITTEEFTLNCGAYEGVALGRPLILGDTRTLRGYFSRGALYVRPEAVQIGQAVRQLVAEQEAMEGEIQQLKTELVEDWQRRFHCLQHLINTGRAA